nr:uncharacterized protein CTRU02_11408 [Colletotrichum truncatum]KAF6785783.1 hypothetical protein CTRU02_11408 [Colletotrichum truncatum]
MEAPRKKKKKRLMAHRDFVDNAFLMSCDGLCFSSTFVLDGAPDWSVEAVGRFDTGDISIAPSILIRLAETNEPKCYGEERKRRFPDTKSVREKLEDGAKGEEAT